MKLLSIDLEFNKEKDILSYGLISSNFFNINFLEEKFFKNKSDKYTYNIHGLNNSFLNKYGTDNHNLKELINSSDMIIGFDLKNDLKVLKMNYKKFYAKNKIIDLKIILSAFKINISLSNLLKKTNIINSYKNLLPIHTSIMDSFLTFLFLEHLVVYIKNKFNIPIPEILSDFSKLSNYKYFNEYWLYEPLCEKYYFLSKLFKEIENQSIDLYNPSPVFYLELTENIEIYNEKFYIIGKYKKLDGSDFNLKKLNIKTKKDISIGYRDFII